MKNFRSSKNLKPMDFQQRDQSQLRLKIKTLEQQILLLQKSNLNIFVPLSENRVHQSIDYKGIISKLKQQILVLEQENQNQKVFIKKMEKQKQQIRVTLTKQIEQQKRKNKQLQSLTKKQSQQLFQLQQAYDKKSSQYTQLQNQLIQKNVQLRFIHKDLQQQTKKKYQIQQQFKHLKIIISQVGYSSRIYKSQQIKCLCIQQGQYQLLKNKIKQLEAQIKAMIDASKRQKITLGVKRNDVGEEIVRLKKNIDLQLGIQGDSRHSQQFLKIYKGTNDLFNKLIKQCQT